MSDAKSYDPGLPIECARTDCKARYYRPQDASAALSTEAVAQLHGWRTIDREGEFLLCVQHAGEAS
jgi:hypothetical protein